MDNNIILSERFCCLYDKYRVLFVSNKYNDYILSLFFLKYVSDIYVLLNKSFEGDGDFLDSLRLVNEWFEVPENCSFEFLCNHADVDNLAELIDKAFFDFDCANILKLNTEAGKGVFSNVNFKSSRLGDNKQRNSILKMLLKDFEELIVFNDSYLFNTDSISKLYSMILEKCVFSTPKSSAEFYTPNEISDLLVKLAISKLDSNLSICDITCGTGSLLIKAAKEQAKGSLLYGQELNCSSWLMAKINMLLNGYRDANIVCADSIRKPKFIQDYELIKFDRLISTIPFSQDNWGAREAGYDIYRRFWRGIPPKDKGDLAFVSHMLQAANDNAVIAAIVPLGVLFRESGDLKIRSSIIEENILDAVIVLPSNLFLSTNVASVILIFKMNRVRKDILFIDASNDFEINKHNLQNKLRVCDIDHIVSTYNKFKSNELSVGVAEDKYSYIASQDEIKDNGYDLSVSLYVDMHEPAPEFDYVAAKTEIAELEKQLIDVQNKIDNYLNSIEL